MGKTCEKCGSEFPVKIKVDGKTRNLCNRRFCLACSPFGNHNTSSEPDKSVRQGTCGEVFESTCPRHGTTEFIVDSELKGRCKKCRVDAVNKCRRNSKQKLVETFGGCCVVCGYNKCQQALQFHHVDPKTKSFGIAMKGHCRKWSEVLEEANKCVLVCANCHAEIESGITQLAV